MKLTFLCCLCVQYITYVHGSNPLGISHKHRNHRNIVPQAKFDVRKVGERGKESHGKQKMDGILYANKENFNKKQVWHKPSTSKPWENPVLIPKHLVRDFLSAIKKQFSDKGYVALAYLLGKVVGGCPKVTHLFIPKQACDEDTCEDTDIRYPQYNSKHGLQRIGMITLHKRQMIYSSEEYHCHYKFQTQFSQHIGIIASIKKGYKMLRLTPKGMQIIGNCLEQGDHEHGQEEVLAYKPNREYISDSVIVVDDTKRRENPVLIPKYLVRDFLSAIKKQFSDKGYVALAYLLGKVVGGCPKVTHLFIPNQACDEDTCEDTDVRYPQYNSKHGLRLIGMIYLHNKVISYSGVEYHCHYKFQKKFSQYIGIVASTNKPYKMLRLTPKGMEIIGKCLDEDNHEHENEEVLAYKPNREYINDSVIVVNDTKLSENPVLLPKDMVRIFLAAIKNELSDKGHEGIGYLLGTVINECPKVTHLFLPRQICDDDTCEDTEARYAQFNSEHGLQLLGWIHTHTRNVMKYSSLDYHCHYKFQKKFSQFIGIIAFTNTGYKTLRLTPKGMEIIGNCDKEHYHDEGNEKVLAYKPNREYVNDSIILIDDR